MPSQQCLHEFQTSWLPNMSRQGLDRLIELLETGSPLLIHGSFTRAVPMGCLATHCGWHHPRTQNYTLEAGICWLTQVAKLNPATSQVIREWDRGSAWDIELRGEFLHVLREYREKIQKMEDQSFSSSDDRHDLVAAR